MVDSLPLASWNDGAAKSALHRQGSYREHQLLRERHSALIAARLPPGSTARLHDPPRDSMGIRNRVGRGGQRKGRRTDQGAPFERPVDRLQPVAEVQDVSAEVATRPAVRFWSRNDPASRAACDRETWGGAPLVSVDRQRSPRSRATTRRTGGSRAPGRGRTNPVQRGTGLLDPIDLPMSPPGTNRGGPRGLSGVQALLPEVEERAQGPIGPVNFREESPVCRSYQRGRSAPGRDRRGR